jgi:hypothetical protein
MEWSIFWTVVAQGAIVSIPLILFVYFLTGAVAVNVAKVAQVRQTVATSRSIFTTPGDEE